jgi:hypothetical protein
MSGLAGPWGLMTAGPAGASWPEVQENSVTACSPCGDGQRGNIGREKLVPKGGAEPGTKRDIVQLKQEHAGRAVRQERELGRAS